MKLNFTEVGVAAILALFSIATFAPQAFAADNATKVRSFKASPSQVSAGQEVSLKWRVKNADNCQLRLDTNQAGTLIEDNIGSSGTYKVTPTQTETYLLYCTKLANRMVYSDSKEVTVKVTKARDSTSSSITTFSISPTTVIFPNPATVVLKAKNVSTCLFRAYDARTGKALGSGNEFTSYGKGTINTTFMVDLTMYMQRNSTIKTRYEAVCKDLKSSKKTTASVDVTGIRY